LFCGQLPLADLADTRMGEAGFASYPGCGLTAPGREMVYRLDLAAALLIDAYVVDRDPVVVDVAILNGMLAANSCVAAGENSASATVGPGPVFIVVDSRSPDTEGEFVVVVQAREAMPAGVDAVAEQRAARGPAGPLATGDQAAAGYSARRGAGRGYRR